MIGRLLAIEWLKARRRPVVRLALFVVPVLVAFFMLPGYLMHRSQPEVMRGIPMPESWPSIIDTSSGILGVIFSAALALVVASEGSWRTQRQNVIDGLSRTEYLAGKLLFGLSLITAGWVLALLSASGMALLDSRVDGGSWAPFAEPVHHLMMAGGFLYTLMMGSIGIFFGLLMRSSGGALACTVLFSVGQAGVILPLLMALGDGWLRAIPFLPIMVGESLRSLESYTGGEAAGSPLPALFESLPAAGAAPVAILYIALFALGGWAILRHRDL